MGKIEDLENFICPLFNCSKAFQRRDLLEQHVMYHAGLCPFMCQYCGLSFKLEQNMLAHQVAKHKEQKEDKTKTIRGFSCCNICLAQIPLKEKKSHILTHLPYTDDELDFEV